MIGHSESNDHINQFKKQKALEQKKDGKSFEGKKNMKRKGNFDGPADGEPHVKKNFKAGKPDGKEKKQFQQGGNGWKSKGGFAAKKGFKPKGNFGGAGQGEPTEKKDWKVVKTEAKEKKQHRKELEGGSGYVLGVKSKKIWEELRNSKIKKERKEQLCQELMGMIKGKIKSMIYAHDTVRVIETLVAEGGEKYITLLFEELKDDIVEMSKAKYSRNFVIKVLRYGSRSQKDFVISSLKGKVVKLMNHKSACDIVELAYNDYANAEQRALMKQEFYGPNFRIFPEKDITSLGQAIEKHPAKKDFILKDMRKALLSIIEKGVFTNTMIHTLLSDYLACCDGGDRAAIIEAMREKLLPILHTQDGAKVAMFCLWHGGAKDRKVILKSFRSNVMKIALESKGYKVILAAFDCVDDTKLLNDIIISELMADLPQLVSSEFGLRILRYIIAPRNPTFFHPDIIAQLTPGDGNAASKKDPEVRQKEIQVASASAIMGLLKANMKSWAFNNNWVLFIAAAFETLTGEYLQSTFEELASVCAEPYEKGKEGHPLEVAHTSKMLTNIIKGDKVREANKKPLFSRTLLKVGGEFELVSWINSNRGCFMFVNMIETEVHNVVSEVKNLLSLYHDEIAGQGTQGSKILLKKLKA